MIQTNDVNVVSMKSLLAPKALKLEIPLTKNAAEKVSQSRKTINAILEGRDSRRLAIVGPCSIHDRISALEYGHRLLQIQKDVEDQLFLVMRVYFEKSRTTIGWRGFIVDPRLDGSANVAIGGLASSREAKSFLGIDQKGQTCIVTTKGNQNVHLILRGGRSGPNYDSQSLDEAEAALTKAFLPPVLVVDCSHANSLKDANRQPEVLKSLAAEVLKGRTSLKGFMLESHLFGGSQKVGPLETLTYGVSVTDPCLGWEQTALALREFADVGRKRS